MKLALAEEMRHLDQAAIAEYRIPGLVLMENAGRGTVDSIGNHFGLLADMSVVVVAGPGNNGGDGLVIARHILQRGGRPRVCLLIEPGKLTGDAAVNLEIINKLEIPLLVADNQDKVQSLRDYLLGCQLIVDAIFGIGLTRDVSGHYATAVDIINASSRQVISVDIPSGLHSDHGHAMGKCVRATLTATYGLAKPGHFLGLGPEATGTLEIIDISLPARAIQAANLGTELLTAAGVSPWLPRRHRTAHKGTFGHLMIVAGSSGKSGAALLCCRGALRSGAGLVSLAAPVTLADLVVSGLPEAMTIILPRSTNGHANIADLETISLELPGKTAMVIGPGLGTDPATGRLVAELYRQIQLPMVVDADGLNLLVAEGIDLRIAAGPRILTPHPGEMARLTGFSSGKIQADRLTTARDFATRQQVYLVLKGPGTVIAAPDGQLAINSSGNQLLAAGGSGDVLAGLIGSLLAQGLSPWQAAGLGVFGHGLAADNLRGAGKLTLGVLASEFADELSGVLSQLTDYLPTTKIFNEEN
ncbi:MAG: NAD(P)H-hydrate dehydratase [Desulfobulbaceae bacterium]|nr:NAD(P)H-hydrate dehydratase [Desulfobulbaceae bacterium]